MTARRFGFLVLIGLVCFFDIGLGYGSRCAPPHRRMGQLLVRQRVPIGVVLLLVALGGGGAVYFFWSAEDDVWDTMPSPSEKKDWQTRVRSRVPQMFQGVEQHVNRKVAGVEDQNIGVGQLIAVDTEEFFDGPASSYSKQAVGVKKRYVVELDEPSNIKEKMSSKPFFDQENLRMLIGSDDVVISHVGHEPLPHVEATFPVDGLVKAFDLKLLFWIDQTSCGDTILHWVQLEPTDVFVWSRGYVRIKEVGGDIDLVFFQIAVVKKDLSLFLKPFLPAFFDRLGQGVASGLPSAIKKMDAK